MVLAHQLPELLDKVMVINKKFQRKMEATPQSDQFLLLLVVVQEVQVLLPIPLEGPEAMVVLVEDARDIVPLMVLELV